MANQYSTSTPPKLQIGAGTALKVGFFGALGVFLFYLIVTIVLGILGLVLAAAGYLGFLSPYLRR